MTPQDRQANLSRREANAALLSLLALSSCGPIRSPRVALTGPGDATLVPAANRLDLVPGHPLICPVRVEGPLPGSTAAQVTLADNRTVEGSLVWIGLQPAPTPGSAWLPGAHRWVVTPVSEGAVPASIGAWHVIADLPADAVGQPLHLGAARLPANWVADPNHLRPDAEPGWAPWLSDQAPPDPDLLAPEWQSPLRRWRALLVTGALGEDTAPARPWPVQGDPAALDQLAELTTARWRVGLARLWYADPDTSRRLNDRLARTISLADGVRAPAWPVSQPLLDSLLADLLDPNLTGEALTSRAHGWLDALPATAAWVEDDAAGLLGADAEPLVQLRAARLDSTPAMCWLAGEANQRVGEPRAMDPAALAEFAAPASAGTQRTGGVEFVLRAGRDALTLTARHKLPIRPPGANCTPLLHDWTLDAWADSDPARAGAPGPGWATAVLLYRDASSGWAAFIECSAMLEGEEEVALHLGQRGAAAAVLRITRAGALRRDNAPGEESKLEIASTGAGWSAVVPIPEKAVEPGNVLRLGVTRRDARGVRTAWPRRMMPWEREPARAAINLNSWGGLSGS